MTGELESGVNALNVVVTFLNNITPDTVEKYIIAGALVLGFVLLLKQFGWF